MLLRTDPSTALPMSLSQGVPSPVGHDGGGNLRRVSEDLEA